MVTVVNDITWDLSAYRVRRSSLAYDLQLNQRIYMDKAMCVVGSLIDKLHIDNMSKRKQPYNIEFQIEEVVEAKKKINIIL